MIEKKQPACSKESQTVLTAMRKAQDSAIRLHRAYNIPMISWEDGKVVEISPFDLQTEDEKAANTSPSE